MRVRPAKETTIPSMREVRVDVKEALIAAILIVGAPKPVYGWVSTLNTQGMKLRSDYVLPPDTECRFRLFTREKQPIADMTGWVVYSKDGSMAVQFDALGDAAQSAVSDTIARYFAT